MTTVDTVVVGGGLAGLAAATLLARGGQRVVLLEGASALGGRARSQRRGEVVFNLGPHALYRAGAAQSLLDRLGVRVHGGVPAPISMGQRGTDIGKLPFDPWSAVTSDLFSAADRWAFARWVAGLPLARPEALAGQTVEDWIGDLPDGAADACRALVRVSTYCSALDALDAGAAVAQLQRALRGVRYLDGGWQALVDGLAEAARTAGVTVHTGMAVRSVRDGVVATDDHGWTARNIVLAVAPSVAASLTGSRVLAERAVSARPIRAACLDLALEGPAPRGPKLLLGLDRPLYVSNHSAVARLAGGDVQVVHASVYGAVGDPAALRMELEAAIDRLWPGWRERMVAARWLPKLIVAQDTLCAGRPVQSVAVADRPGVYVAGDWVGDAMLADAAADSAERAARAILASAAEEAA